MQASRTHRGRPNLQGRGYQAACGNLFAQGLIGLQTNEAWHTTLEGTSPKETKKKKKKKRNDIFQTT